MTATNPAAGDHHVNRSRIGRNATPSQRSTWLRCCVRPDKLPPSAAPIRAVDRALEAIASHIHANRERLPTGPADVAEPSQHANPLRHHMVALGLWQCPKHLWKYGAVD